MERALREGREGADRLDLVAEELDAQRLAAGRREDVDDPAAHRELTTVVDALAARVAGEGERLRQTLDAELAAGGELGVEGLSEALALAGYARGERVDDRGQFAVRGGIVDVFPTTGREPLRVEFFGDEIESIRAFSPFTQRALHPVDATVIYPAAERRLDLVDDWPPPHMTLDDDDLRPIPN